jgi:hypothetical protein
VTYAYTPQVFEAFMKRNYASSGGTYTLGETIYQTPRGQWPVLLQSNVSLPAAHVPLRHPPCLAREPLLPFGRRRPLRTGAWSAARTMG